ncbi:MAG: hypothetical protein ACKPCI_26210, partial [Dolichospermum sp.]
SWRPGKLFDTVNRALTIFVNKSAKEKAIFTTSYQKWNADSRDLLFTNLNYTYLSQYPDFWKAKISDKIENQILAKFIIIKTSVNKFIEGKKEHNRVYYRTDGGLYWKIFTDFPPKFVVNDKEGHSTRETWVSCYDKITINSLIACLSSDLFWWWYTVTSNCRHLNPYDIYNFPISESALYDSQLIKLGKEYLVDIEK